MTSPQRYLGDGVYASWDGYQIILQTERLTATGQTRTHWIALDEEVLAGLNKYSDDVTAGEIAAERRKRG